jgi:succinate-semialdehyde dehydrogenase / glutarate-semialdehyde dehydrogenase
MVASERPPAVAQDEHLVIVNPVSREQIGSIPVTTHERLGRMVRRARAAQRTWGAMEATQRAALIRRWGDILWQERYDLIAAIREETGKTTQSALLEVIGVDNIVGYYTQKAPALLRPQRARPLIPLIQRARIHHKPYGVVGVIGPFNYPYLLVFMDAIPALLAGNAVVLKPSDLTPFTAEYGLRTLHMAGIPEDVVQIAHGDYRTGAALVDLVDYVHFTGSTDAGRQVAQAAAARMIPCSLELGGNDPSIVLADADLDFAAAGLLLGAFENAGQACVSVERAYVVEPIYDEFIEHLLEWVRQFSVGAGNSMDVHMGSLTHPQGIAKIEAHIRDALAKGARILYGGQRRPDLGPLFFEPTILVDVDHTMDVMREESFGPLLPVMRVADAQEAIRLANDSSYGLSASIFSRNLRRAEELALQLNCGDVSINRTHLVIGTPDLPSGGQKLSGLGRRNGEQGLLKYTATQSILADTNFGQVPDLRLADPTSLKLLLFLRVLRRFLRFL